MVMNQRSAGISTSHPRSSITSKYDDFQPHSKWKEDKDAHILLIQLPGFEKEQIKVTFVHYSHIISVRGERPINNYSRWSRFNQPFPIPENTIDQIHAKFENGILTITIPKDTTTTQQVLPKQETKTSTTPSNIPKPSSISNDLDKSQKLQTEFDHKGPKQSLSSSPKETSTTQSDGKIKEMADSVAAESQKGQEHDQLMIPTKKQSADQKRTSTVEASTLPTAFDPNQSDDHNKIKTKVDPIDALESRKMRELDPLLMPPKQSSNDQKSTTTLGENNKGKTIVEMGKRKVVKLIGDIKQEEGNEENRLKGLAASAKGAVKNFSTSAKEESREINQEVANEEKRLKGLAASAKGAVKNFTKRFKEEDRQTFVNVGAAILVILAIGVYASYTFGSSSSENADEN